MNKKQIKNVIRALKETPHKDRFDMASWAHPCGTPACAIGNYAQRTDLQDTFCLRAGDWGGMNLINTVDDTVAHLEDEVAEHFDLSEEEAEMLFGQQGCGGATTTEQAIEFLEWYLQRPEFAS